MTPAEMIAWVMTWSLLLDGTPRDPVRHPIKRPEFAGLAFVTAANEHIADRTKRGLPSAAPELYVAFLDVFAARESGYRVDLAGDCPGMPAGDPHCTVALGAKSYGAWQTPVAMTPKSTSAGKQALAVAQAKVALDILDVSMAACPSHPIAMYMSGRCVALGAMREGEIATQMATPLPSSSSAAGSP